MSLTAGGGDDRFKRIGGVQAGAAIMVIEKLPATVMHVTVLLALFVPVLFGDGYAVWQMNEY